MIETITEVLRKDGKLWVVILVIFIVLAGWLYDLLSTQNRVKKIKERIRIIKGN